MSEFEVPWGSVPHNWIISSVDAEAKKLTDYVANGSFASLAENVEYKTDENYAVLIRLVDYNNSFKGPFVFIDENAYNFLSKSKLFGGEIIISNVGANVGTVFLCPYLKYKMSLAPNAITVHFKGNDLFYYYWLRSKYGQHGIKSLITGSAQPKFNKTAFRQMLIPVPPIDVQNQIAGILSSLDAKIETNNKLNEKLEEMAQAIFKSWFVDFEPFKNQPFHETELGRIPEGWEVKRISENDFYITDFVSNGSFASLKQNVSLLDYPDYAYFIRNTDLKEGSFKVYVNKDSYDFLSKSKLLGGEIIISNVGDVGSVFLCPRLDKPMTLGNNIIMIKLKDEIFKYYLFQFFSSHIGQHLIDGISGGSVQRKFNKTDFRAMKIMIPSINVLSNYHSVIKSVFDFKEMIRIENDRLASLRDTLLPRLMSGEIKT